jgi:regulator of protease activity HflC (stomatin/prohibitin superfamily)
MASPPPDVPQRFDPFASLETGFMSEYLRARGHDPEALRARGDAEARRLLVEASTYAAARLTEVECRAHYVQDMHAGR